MNKSVIIVAGGKGLRMGGELPKQFIPFSGKPVLMHTLEVFYDWDQSIEVILVLPKDHHAYWEMLCTELNCLVPHQIVEGGETRFHSVLNGLKAVRDTGLVAVHDGVRPFVAPEVITGCFEMAEKYGAAIPVLSVIESLRKKEGAGSIPVDRSLYVTVQTPQVFRSELLYQAYRQPYSTLFTDDASVVESMGEKIYPIPGNRENIKITEPLDLLIAEALFSKKYK